MLGKFKVVLSFVEKQIMNFGVPFKKQTDPSKRTDAVSPIPPRYDGAVRRAGSLGVAQSIPQLIGDLYCSVGPQMRVKLLEHLMRPLGVLSLAAVANGVFAKIRFRSRRPDLKIRADDVAGVKRDDVVSLADHVQQVDEDVIDGLASLLRDWPAAHQNQAAAMLIQLLYHKSSYASSADASGSKPSWH